MGKYRDKVFINADGGSRKNPGPAAIGIIIRDENGNVLDKHSERIGEATSNTAEYKALIKALEMAAKHTREEVQIFMDSEFVIKQVTGKYRVKAKHLYPLCQEIKNQEKFFSKVTYNFVNRNNKFQVKADKLVNEALDNGED